MPRNVTRILPRSCAQSQRPKGAISTPFREYHSRELDLESKPPTAKEWMRVLQDADQVSLQDTIKSVDGLKEAVRQLRATATSKLRTEIQSPTAAIKVKYTLGPVRSAVCDNIPQLAADTLTALDNVRLHLTDLQVEEYVAGKDEEARLREFEKEVRDWSQEEKEEKLRSVKDQETAMLSTLQMHMEKLMEHTAALNVGGTRMRASIMRESNDETMSEPEKNEREENTRMAIGSSSSLQDVQKQLEAYVNPPQFKQNS